MILASSLIPPEYTHIHHPSTEFYTNITGFYRDARAHPLNLSSIASTGGSSHSSHSVVTPHPGSQQTTDTPLPHSSTEDTSHFWRHVDHKLFAGYQKSLNNTLSNELRGTFDWENVDKFEMNLKERDIDYEDPFLAQRRTKDQLKNIKREYKDWTWVKGSATLFTSTVPLPLSSLSSADSLEEKYEETRDQQEITYNFYGLHHLPNGSYTLIAKPDGYRIDIRDLPPLLKVYGEVVHEQAVGIVALELDKEVRREEGLMISGEARSEPTSTSLFYFVQSVKLNPLDSLTTVSMWSITHWTSLAISINTVYTKTLTWNTVNPSIYTKCPLQIHLTLPPLPPTTSLTQLKQYQAEQIDPTGLGWSLPRPPGYWETGSGLGGVIIAEECGWGFGIEGGNGIAIDDFWRKSVNCGYIHCRTAQLKIRSLVQLTTHRCGIRDFDPINALTPIGQTDGNHSNPINIDENLTVVNCNNGHIGFLDLLSSCSRRYRL